ncbi:WAT1-related protein [Sesamum alatum]|uniref:WAT1-related protein n=1 Tax=Sesamum alatum TaxID=300844 RepID=A0AAE1YRZ3_9LAMI|nr:WAT1-related protein [Sesamum alatum]
MGDGLKKKLKVYLSLVVVQFGNVGMAIVAKAALNQGTSHYTFSVYRNIIAALLFAPFAFVTKRKIRPKMTFSVFIKIMLLGLLDPVFAQNMLYSGLKYKSATFTAAMCNLVPAITFVMAWILRIEKVNLRDARSYAKIVGTMVTVGGAMIMTLLSGPVIPLPWTHNSHHSHSSSNSNDHENLVKGALMIAASCFGSSLFYILQAVTLKTYPAGLSLTTLICTFGALEGTVLTFIVERGNTAIWALGWNAKLLAYVYGGIVASGMTYYLSGVIMKEKGPVFLTAFNPCTMVIVAIFSSFIFHEQMTVGKVTGALVIVAGLYFVIWGKSKDHMETAVMLTELPQQNPPAAAANHQDPSPEPAKTDGGF